MNDQVDAGLVETLRAAWVETRMEKDRTLLTVASGGIGLLTTLGTTVGPSSILELIVYALAGACFVSAIVLAVCVFDRNSRHIKEVIRTGNETDDPKLVRMDRMLFWSFVAGVVLTGVIALTSGYSHIRKAQDMAEQNRVITGQGQEQKSLSGIGGLRPAGGGTASQGSGTGSSGAGASTTTGGSTAGSGGAAQSGDKK